MGIIAIVELKRCILSIGTFNIILYELNYW